MHDDETIPRRWRTPAAETRLGSLDAPSHPVTTRCRYPLPPLDEVGQYRTCGGCGEPVELQSDGYRVCRCQRYHPRAVVPYCPDPLQIRHAKRLMAEALLAQMMRYAGRRGRTLSYEGDDEEAA